MRKIKRSGLFASFAAIALLVLGCGVYGLASKEPSPVKNAVMTVTAPVERGITAVTAWLQSIRDYMKGIDDLKEENAALRQQLAAQEAEIRQAEALEAENSSLRALLNVSERHREYDLVMAEVVGTESGGWGYSYVLNVGTNDGIKAGVCVIADEGMVGWIQEVGESWSILAPLTSTELKASAVITRTRETGVLEGDYTLSASGCLKLSYLPGTPELMAGDTVETSGSDDNWPAGLIVGTVSELRLAADGLSLFAVVEPVCPLETLEQVYVVRSFTVTD